MEAQLSDNGYSFSLFKWLIIIIIIIIIITVIQKI